MSGITPQYFSHIISAFDQDLFNIPSAEPITFARNVIVVHQLENNLITNKKIPREIIDIIVRVYLEKAPSVTALWMYYGGSSLVKSKYSSLPLSANLRRLNNASKILLIKLQQPVSEEKRDYFKQLMSCVLKHHFTKLNPSQRFQLFQRYKVNTSWEQKSADEKLEFLGRIQKFCGWSHPHLKLQFLIWKVRFAIAYVLKIKILFRMIVIAIFTLASIGLTQLFVSIFQDINHRTFKNPELTTFINFLIEKRKKEFWINFIGGVIFLSGGITISFNMFIIGVILNTRYFSIQIQRKGILIQNISMKFFMINLECFFLVLDLLFTAKRLEQKKNQETNDQNNKFIDQVLDNMSNELKEAINEAQLSVEQATFLEAQLPDLMEKWQVFVAEKFHLSDTDTGSLLTQPPLGEAGMVR
ncbi:MAG: hypothetical protein JSS10_06130 [Verrucomicrobia bacterium]|nr:hypothetical protein [Verrucomicrobiota bacterium]